MEAVFVDVVIIYVDRSQFIHCISMINIKGISARLKKKKRKVSRLGKKKDFVGFGFRNNNFNFVFFFTFINIIFIF